MQVLGEDLRIFVQRPVLDAAFGDGPNQFMVLNASNQKLKLQGERPTPHTGVIIAEKAVIYDRFVEQLKAEMLADEFGGRGFPGANIARHGNKHLLIQIHDALPYAKL
jgi:hypothetical protein